MNSVSSALRTMRHPVRARERWSEVTPAEFEAFLRDYPRKLEVDPPLIHLADYREWSDPALGKWPDNAVAITSMRGRYTGYQIRRW